MEEGVLDLSGERVTERSLEQVGLAERCTETIQAVLGETYRNR